MSVPDPRGTVSVHENARLVFEAMGAGAVDAVDTPALGSEDFEKVSAPLLAKLNSMRGLLGSTEVSSGREAVNKPVEASSNAPLVVIGASAGGLPRWLKCSGACQRISHPRSSSFNMWTNSLRLRSWAG